MTNASDGKRDFFISFNKADREWATWIAWVLEEASYTVWFQDWDFRGNFVKHMNQAHAQADRTLAVVTDHYFGSDFTLAEWSARFAQDPSARNDRLVPVKVGPLTGETILGPIIYADLMGCEEAEAERQLLGRVKKAIDPRYRDKSPSRPGFPGGPPRQVPKRPRFPTAVHNHSPPYQIPQHEFRFRSLGEMDHIVSLILEVKDVHDEKRVILLGDLRAGGLRPIGHRNQHMHMGLRKVRIKLNCQGCSPVPGLGEGDDTGQSHTESKFRVSRLSSTLWEIAIGIEELCLDGYLIRNARLTPLAMYEDGKALVEATLRAYPKDIELQDLSEDPSSSRSDNIRMKLLKSVLRKAIKREGDEIIIMQYHLDQYDDK